MTHGTHHPERTLAMRRIISKFLVVAAALTAFAALAANPAAAGTWSSYTLVHSHPIRDLATPAFSYCSSLDAFAISPQFGDSLLHNFDRWSGLGPNGAWVTYSQVATNPIRRVAATQPYCGRYDVFVVGTDNALWHNTYANGAWSGYTQVLPVKRVKAVTATSLPNGRIDVFVVDAYDAVWTNALGSGGWSGYTRVGTNAVKAVAAASNDDLYVIGTNDAVYRNRLVNNSWTGYQPINLMPVKALSVTSLGGAQIDLFAIALSDSALWHMNTNPNGSWTPYSQRGANQIKGVAATTPYSGRMDILAIGTDDALWQKTYK